MGNYSGETLIASTRSSLVAKISNMRRISVYRDGNQMAAQIGPDWVEGIAGFGGTAADALRGLASSFADHGYELRGKSAVIKVGGQFIEVTACPGQMAPDVLRALARIVEDLGFRESDFLEPDWDWLAKEERVVSRNDRRN
jgi:hypothetical protein